MRNNGIRIGAVGFLICVLSVAIQALGGSGKLAGTVYYVGFGIVVVGVLMGIYYVAHRK